jgi:hypothetical protein
MHGEALKYHSVCSRFVLTPLDGLSFIRLWPCTSRQCSGDPSSKIKKIHRRVLRARRATGKKSILPLHSRIWLFCLGPAHVVLIGPLKWRLLWLYRGSLHWRGPEIKIFLVFDPTSFLVGRPSRVGRALGALILKPGLE